MKENNLNYFRVIGAWIAMLSDQVIRWIGITLRYRTGKWKYIKLQ